MPKLGTGTYQKDIEKLKRVVYCFVWLAFYFTAKTCITFNLHVTTNTNRSLAYQLSLNAMRDGDVIGKPR